MKLHAILWLFCASTISFPLMPKIAPEEPQEVHVVSEQAHIDIRTKKVIHLIGPVTRSSVADAAREGAATEKLPGDRVVIINTNGGDVDAGLMLIRALQKESVTEHIRIVCVVEHKAHSMGFNLLSFCDVRLATAKSKMVAHKVALGYIPWELRGTAKNLRKLARELDQVDQIFDTQNRTMMHLDKKHYDMYADRENMWTAEQLVLMGYLQGIATVE